VQSRSEKTRPAPSAGRYLVVALYAFAVFGWELAVTVLLDPLWASTGATASALLHWAVTAAGWLVGAIAIIRWIRAEADGATPVFGPALRGHVAPRTVGIILAVAVAIGVRAAILQEWKLVGEYGRLAADDQGTAPLLFAVLLAYYLCEVAVVVLLVVLGQRAGELRFGRPAVPWGGLVLALTWGATHILLQGPATGLYAMLASLLYGLVFSLGNRRFAATSALIAVAFLL